MALDKEKIKAFFERHKAKAKEEQKEFEEETRILNRNSAYAKAVDKAAASLKKEASAVQKGDDVLLRCENVTKIYANRVEAVHDFNLDIKDGEFIVLVGPSGCGKSTTLRMIAGLEDITYGSLYIGGRYSNELLPKERGVSMVFQSYALYPHMSVYDNMAFGLSGLEKEEIDRRIKEASELLEITPYLDRKPTALSGGQCQRVALGRAIVRNAKIFLLDEPLSNLDAKLRVQMRSELIKLHDRLKNTMIYVTHDQTEAMTMADRIVVMKNGYIQQVGTPREIYDHPRNVFVATFIGSPTMNIVKAVYEEGQIRFADGSALDLKEEGKKILAYYENEVSRLKERLEALRADRKTREQMAEEKKILGTLPPHYDEEESQLEKEIASAEAFLEKKGGDIYFGIRPEDIVLGPKGTHKGAIDVAELLGAEYYVHVAFAGQKIVAKISASDFHSGKPTVGLSFKKGKHHLFDVATGLRIL